MADEYIQTTEDDFGEDLRPMGFGDMFGKAWSLTASTFSNGGILALVTLVPLGWFSMSMTQKMMIEFADLARQGPQMAEGAGAAGLLGSIALSFLVSLLSLVVFALAQTGLTVASWEALNGNRISFGEMLRLSVNKNLWYNLIQILMMVAIYIMASFVVGLLGMVVGLVTLGIGSLLIMLAFYGALIYMLVATSLRVHETVVESRGPWQGTVASVALVKGNWWRAFGLQLLLWVIFAGIQLALFIPTIGALADVMPRDAASYDSQNPEAVFELYGMIANAFNPALFPVIALVGALSIIVYTNALTALYADLRARRGDFDADRPDWDVEV